MQRYGGVNSFLWTAISCDWFKRENPLPNDNIKYSELQFNWYGCLMSCDIVSIMKRVLECCQTNLLDRVMSEWSGCASPSVTKALPFLTSCEPPDTQHVLHFLLVFLRSPTPSLSLKWPATDANSNRLPWGPKVWDYIEMIGIKTGSKVLGFQRNGTTNSHEIYNKYYRFLTTRSSVGMGIVKALTVLLLLPIPLIDPVL